jgi:aryl-alcohol dehydrogenase-like predicted oxidoreductase
LAQSPHACVIPGFKNARQVESNAQAAGRPLSAEDVTFIKATLQGG